MEENKTEKKRRGKNRGGEANGKGKRRKFLTEHILFFVGKETEENIWRRKKKRRRKRGKIFSQWRRRKAEKEKEENIRRRKIFCQWGRRKRGRYLERENIWSAEEKKMEKEKEENIWRMSQTYMADTQRHTCFALSLGFILCIYSS